MWWWCNVFCYTDADITNSSSFFFLWYHPTSSSSGENSRFQNIITICYGERPAHRQKSMLGAPPRLKLILICICGEGVSEGSQEPKKTARNFGKNRTKIHQIPKNPTKIDETSNRRNGRNQKTASKFWESGRTAQKIASNRKTANLWPFV